MCHTLLHLLHLLLLLLQAFTWCTELLLLSAAATGCPSCLDRGRQQMHQLSAGLMVHQLRSEAGQWQHLRLRVLMACRWLA
jgi:hypothetical protein